MKRINFFGFIAAILFSAGLVSCGGDGSGEPANSGGSGIPTLKGKVGEAVDLGLPSGNLWASWNIGASSREDYGCYYSWGELYNKSNYTLMTYEYYNEWQEYTEIGEDISGTNYDIATIMWGDDWHMPSVEEFQELIDYCLWEWIKFNDVAWGYKVTGPNGEKIFFPATGYYDGSYKRNYGTSGYYWSGLLRKDDVSLARALCFDSSNTQGNGGAGYYCGYTNRYYGLAIRPVKKNAGESGNEKPSVAQSFDIFQSLEKDEMIFVEGGTFTMGATSEQGVVDPSDNERPTHKVTLSDFYIGKYEVTQQIWEYVMGYNPSYFKGDYLPVECVTWNDCQEFITKLNQLTGKSFRFPTEAEWEYAARGGINSKEYRYAGSSYADEVAWYQGNSNSTTHEVGTKLPNELGLYDMSGNVWEWCGDWWGSYPSSLQYNPTGPSEGSLKVYRGGNYKDEPQYCRTAFRQSFNPNNLGPGLGIRLVCQ